MSLAYGGYVVWLRRLLGMYVPIFTALNVSASIDFDVYLAYLTFEPCPTL